MNQDEVFFGWETGSFVKRDGHIVVYRQADVSSDVFFRLGRIDFQRLPDSEYYGDAGRILVREYAKNVHILFWRVAEPSPSIEYLLEDSCVVHNTKLPDTFMKILLRVPKDRFFEDPMPFLGEVHAKLKKWVMSFYQGRQKKHDPYDWPNEY